MNRSEKSVALFLAVSAVGALLLVACQEIAGSVLARVLDMGSENVWAGLGLRRAPIFKIGLFLAVVPLLLEAAGKEGLLRRLAVGLTGTAVFTWAVTGFVFKEGDLALVYVLLGIAATFASIFEGARRAAAAAALGLVVAATSLAAQGESLGAGRNFGAMIVIGIAFCAPAIALVAFTPELVERGLLTIDDRRRRG
jgi:hypothetical protein